MWDRLFLVLFILSIFPISNSFAKEARNLPRWMDSQTKEESQTFQKTYQEEGDGSVSTDTTPTNSETDSPQLKISKTSMKVFLNPQPSWCGKGLASSCFESLETYSQNLEQNKKFSISSFRSLDPNHCEVCINNDGQYASLASLTDDPDSEFRLFGEIFEKLFCSFANEARLNQVGASLERYEYCDNHGNPIIITEEIETLETFYQDDLVPRSQYQEFDPISIEGQVLKFSLHSNIPGREKTSCNAIVSTKDGNYYTKGSLGAYWWKYPSDEEREQNANKVFENCNTMLKAYFSKERVAIEGVINAGFYSGSYTEVLVESVKIVPSLQIFRKDMELIDEVKQ